MPREMAKVSIVCNSPKGYRGDVRIIIGINDEKVGEGRPDERIELSLPSGEQEVLVLVTNGTVNTITGTTKLFIQEGDVYRIKYSLFAKKASLVATK